VADENDSPAYVFSKDAVLRAIRFLEEAPIHEHFAAYLAILRANRSHPSDPVRSSDITDFHDRFLRVHDAPEKAPYVRPFRSRGRGLQAFNANVAGSYAPSSLRAGTALIGVVSISGSRSTVVYSLRENHASLALEHLLSNTRVPVIALAAFLYRDYGFHLEAPEISRVVQIFRDDFFGSGEDAETSFKLLFDDDQTRFAASDLELLGTMEVENG